MKMKIAQIISVPAFNVARAVVNGASYTKGTSEELASSMLQLGWDETSFIGVRIPTEDELLIASDYLIMELARLEDLEGQEIAYNLTLRYEDDSAVKTKVSNEMVAAEFKKTYFTRSGELKSLAKARVTVFGHHRTHMILAANAARASHSLEPIEPKVLDRVYDTEEEWRDACIQENAQRERAATGVSAIDVLRQAYELRNSGFTESKHRKELGNKKVGMIQRAWRFLKLDAAFPDENLYGRAMLKEDNKKRIAFKSLEKERLQRLLATDEAGESSSKEEVMSYINAPLAKVHKPLTMADLKTIQASSANPMLKGLLADITSGQRGSLTFLNNNSILYKAVHQSLPKDVPVMDFDEMVGVLQAAIDLVNEARAKLEE